MGTSGAERDMGAADELECALDLPEFDIQIRSESISAKPRMLGSWNPSHSLKERSAVDRMAAVARGEPDPGAKLPDPFGDLRDLWSTDATFEMLAEMEKVIDEETDREIERAIKEAGDDVGHTEA